MSTMGGPQNGLLAGAARGMGGVLGAAPRRRGVWDVLGELFTGPQAAGVSPEQEAAARRQALVRGGLATLIANGQPGANSLSALAQGVLAGQQIGGDARAQAQLGNIAPMGAEIDLPTLHKLFAFYSSRGMVEEARSTAEVIKAREAADARRSAPEENRYINVGGALYDPVTGQWMQPPKGAPEEKPIRVGGRDFPNTPEGAEAAAAWQRRLYPIRETPGASFSRENQLRDDYRTETKDILNAYTFIDSALKGAGAAQNGDPTAQVALLYAFVKALDPNSVVREGEIKLASAAAPVWQRAQKMYEEYTQGKSPAIPSPMVDQMVAFMRNMQHDKQQQLRAIHDNYVSVARRYNVDPATFRAPPGTNVLDNY